ncbi:hypothetical protein Msi02_83380 [Microbispora siamensis]|uniref:Uncharacterized protein n=2 Tax=Microbispora siamensis TaxID=564413 RepID=A0ABQ4H1G1_9ACTN|nr:hypothetical protein Msi02_83380 [Microbispora siamensis]
MTLLAEARAVLARYDRALRTMAAYTSGDGGVLRVGIPLELPPDLLGPALEQLAVAHPGTRVQARHPSIAEAIVVLASPRASFIHGTTFTWTAVTWPCDRVPPRPAATSRAGRRTGNTG